MFENKTEIDSVCEDCGKIVSDHLSLHYVCSIDGGNIKVCIDCFGDYTHCWDCDKYFHNDTVNYIDTLSDYVCDDCYENNFSNCRGCDYLYYIDDLCDGYCENCECNEEGYCDNFDFEFLSTNNETRVNGNILYFGIELEVGSTERNVHYGDILSDYTNSRDRVIHLTDDCSILDNCDIYSGCELVANPATYNWFMTNRDIWSGILKTLKENGIWSYKTGSCGIHIHLSKNVFTTSHLYNFLKMVYANPDFTLLISQRGSMGLSRWSSITNESSDEIIKRKADRKYSHDKYTAVNLVHSDTIEVRIFRGTLHEGSFYKNIEYLQALFEFTEHIEQSSLTVENYIKYVSINKNRFSDLYNFLKLKRQIPNVLVGNKREISLFEDSRE